MVLLQDPTPLRDTPSLKLLTMVSSKVSKTVQFQLLLMLPTGRTTLVESSLSMTVPPLLTTLSSLLDTTLKPTESRTPGPPDGVNKVSSGSKELTPVVSGMNSLLPIDWRVY